jgi:hypothetical protein
MPRPASRVGFRFHNPDANSQDHSAPSHGQTGSYFGREVESWDLCASRQAVQRDRTYGVCFAFRERNKRRNKRLFAHFGTTNHEFVASTRFIFRSSVMPMSAHSVPQFDGLPRLGRPCSERPMNVTIRGPNPCCFLKLTVRPCDRERPLFRTWHGRLRVLWVCFEPFLRRSKLWSVGRYSQPGLARQNLPFLRRHFRRHHALAQHIKRRTRTERAGCRAIVPTLRSNIHPRAALPLTHLAEIKELRFCHRPWRRVQPQRKKRVSQTVRAVTTLDYPPPQVSTVRP